MYVCVWCMCVCGIIYMCVFVYMCVRECVCGVHVCRKDKIDGGKPQS